MTWVPSTRQVKWFSCALPGHWLKTHVCARSGAPVWCVPSPTTPLFEAAETVNAYVFQWSPLGLAPAVQRLWIWVMFGAVLGSVFAGPVPPVYVLHSTTPMRRIPT